MWRVAALADDDLVGEVISADATAGLIQQLRLVASDEFDSRGGRQVQLIVQGTDPFDELLQINSARRAPDFAHDEPAGRKAERDLAGNRLPPELIDAQADAIRQDMPHFVAVAR
jgi:hypothetical protein